MKTAEPLEIVTIPDPLVPARWIKNKNETGMLLQVAMELARKRRIPCNRKRRRLKKVLVLTDLGYCNKIRKGTEMTQATTASVTVTKAVPLVRELRVRNRKGTEVAAITAAVSAPLVQ